MDDVPFVRGLDAVDQLLNDRQSFFKIERPAQVGTLDILHDEVVRGVF